jgi:hypothetical protein
MEILFNYEQSKLTRGKPLNNICKLKLAADDDFILFTSEYYAEYIRLGKKNYLTYEHGLTINKKTGDLNTIYKLLNKKDNTYLLQKNTIKAKKNDFEMLLELTAEGFYNGQKRCNWWGVRYQRACTEILRIIAKEINFDIVSQDRDSNINPLYDMLVDFHMAKKQIKAHNCVYWDICEVYPKKKYLKANENKFVPAILDEFGIKSKYLVGVLSSRRPTLPKLNIASLRFICTLFGDNYLDYIKEFDWQLVCSEHIFRKKFFTCEDEAEKKALLKSLKNYCELDGLIHGVLHTIQDLFILKELLRKNGLDVRVRGNSPHHLSTLRDTWELHRKHYKLGYRLRYALPEEMVEDLEESIVVGDKTFKPKLILTEDEFKVEGMIMKNCMANQFAVGNLYVHASISLGKKRINIQYRRGLLNQNRGKANSNSPKEFAEAVEIFTKKMAKYENVVPIREKYDIIKPSKSID